jgi:L-amino acid N-acyltransferase YncA
LYEDFGFEFEGKKQLFGYGDGRWSDAYFMARLHP